MFRCERWVRLGRGRLVERSYASERVARSVSARYGYRVEECGSEEVRSHELSVYHYPYDGFRAHGGSSFSGVEVVCARCRSRLAEYSRYELAELAERAVLGT